MIIRYRTGPDGQRVCPAPSCVLVKNVKNPDAHLAWHKRAVGLRLAARDYWGVLDYMDPDLGRWSK